MNEVHEKSLSEMVKQYQSGDTLYATELFDSGFRVAYSVAYSHTYNQEQATDLAQETMIKVFEKIDTCNPDSYIGWIKVIAKNKCLDYFDSAYHKHETSFNQIEDKDGEEMEFQIEDERIMYQPELQLDENTRNDIVRDVLNHLSDDQKVVTMMYYYDNMSLKEISEKLGVEMSTVTGRFSLAKKNIKKEVEMIQKRDDLKLYNISAVPAIPLFIYLLGKFNPANTIPATTISSVVIKKSAEEVVGKSVGKTAATKAAVSTGLSTGTKVAIGATVAIATIGGGYLLTRNHEDEIVDEPQVVETATPEATIETIDFKGMSLNIPAGWTYEETVLSDSGDNLFGQNGKVPAIYLYSGDNHETDPYIVISSFEIANIGLGEVFEDVVDYGTITVAENTYSAEYSYEHFLSGLNYYFPEEKYYSIQLLQEGNLTWPQEFGGGGHNPGIHILVNYFDHGTTSIDNEDLQEVLGSIKMNPIGTFTSNGVATEGYGMAFAIYTIVGDEITAGYNVDLDCSFDVYEIKELNGITYYRLGLYSWASSENGNFTSY